MWWFDLIAVRNFIPSSSISVNLVHGIPWVPIEMDLQRCLVGVYYGPTDLWAELIDYLRETADNVQSKFPNMVILLA